MSYSVTQNTFFLTAASVFQKIISFAYFTLVARFVGVENTGQYFFAIAFTTIFTVIADFGLCPVLTRETAKYPENSEKYLNSLLLIKFLFGLFAVILVVVFVNLLAYQFSLKLLVYVSGITMFFDNLQSVFYSVFRARKNLIYECFGIVGSQLLTLIIGTIALIKHWPLVWLIVAYTIPSALSVIYSSYFLKKTYKFHYHLVWNKLIFLTFIGLAWPFALAGIVSRLYSYTDSILISKMLPPSHLGWWSVPYKITFAFQFIATSLSTSVYPAMSTLWLTDKDRVARLFIDAWKYLFIIVFPLSMGLMAVAYPVIIKLYGKEFAPSVIVLQILLVGLIFGFLSFITGALLNAANNQTKQTGLLAATLILNVALNAILLPRYGVNGAAISALAGNILLCLGGLFYVSRLIAVPYLDIFKGIFKTFFPALIMAILAYYAGMRYNVIFVIMFAVILYFLLLFLTGALNKKMIKEFSAKLFFKKDGAQNILIEQ